MYKVSRVWPARVKLPLQPRYLTALMLNAITTPNNDPNVVVQLYMVTRQGLTQPCVPSLGSIPAGQDEGLSLIWEKLILVESGIACPF
jgi:hypothetical protein